MTNRIIVGSKGGASGLWISKPGVDVLSASPGQFLLDTTSTIYQIIYAGDTLINASTTFLPLPGNAVAYSNMFIWAYWYYILNGSVAPAPPFSRRDYNIVMILQTIGGNLRIDSPVTSGSFSNPVHVRWVIFRNNF